MGFEREIGSIEEPANEAAAEQHKNYLEDALEQIRPEVLNEVRAVLEKKLSEAEKRASENPDDKIAEKNWLNQVDAKWVLQQISLLRSLQDHQKLIDALAKSDIQRVQRGAAGIPNLSPDEHDGKDLVATAAYQLAQVVEYTGRVKFPDEYEQQLHFRTTEEEAELQATKELLMKKNVRG